MTADGRKTHGLCNHSCRIVSLSACLCHVHLMTLTEQCMLGLKAFCWGAEPFFSHCLKMSGSVTSSSTAGLDDGLNPLGFSNLAEFDDEEQRLLSELQDECLCRVGLSLSLCLSLSLSPSLSVVLSVGLCFSVPSHSTEGAGEISGHRGQCIFAQFSAFLKGLGLGFMVFRLEPLGFIGGFYHIHKLRETQSISNLCPKPYISPDTP